MGNASSIPFSKVIESLYGQRLTTKEVKEKGDYDIGRVGWNLGSYFRELKELGYIQVASGIILPTILKHQLKRNSFEKGLPFIVTS